MSLAPVPPVPVPPIVPPSRAAEAAAAGAARSADRAALRRVLALFLAHRRGLLGGGALLAALTVVAGVGLLGLSGWFISATGLAGLTLASAWSFDVFAPGAGVRLLALGRTASRYGERVLTHDATLAVLAALRPRLFRGWARPQAARSLLARPARLLFRLTADIDALDTLYLRGLVPAGAALAAALASGLLIGVFVDALLGAVVAAVLISAGVLTTLAAARAADRPARRQAAATEALRARTIDLVAGQTTLLMAGRLPAQRRGVLAADRRQAAADDRLHRIDTRAGLRLGIVGTLLTAGTLVAGAALVEAGRAGLPLVVLAVLATLAAMEPFAALRRGAVAFGRTRLAARRLAPRLDAVPPAADGPVPAAATLRLDQATVVHPGAAAAALHGVTLVLAPGERVAVVGASGSGKSTLLAAVAGELPLAAGRIEAPRCTLLTQRTELFQDTLRDNLRLADPSADDTQLREALEAAGLGAHLATLPQGLATPLGEGGLGLSVGQARRLALARLLLRADTLWLLDEPTESLDAATAADVMQRLAAPGAGWLLATHLRREAAHADRLLQLRGGRVIAEARRGTPDFDTLLGTLRPD